MKMEICRIKSVQRVANFTLDDGKMLEVEHSDTIIPGVTMTCDLPLLFRNGFPTCLENLTVGQLEKFVPYMIRCSGIPLQTKPKWWPNEILFSSKLAKEPDMSDKNWLSYLKRLVLHCYSYHGCEYALKLCADSSHECRSIRTECRLENSPTPVYKVPRQMPTTRRSTKMCCNEGHIRENGSVSNNPPRGNLSDGSGRNTSPMQIYLCGNCDSEFRTSKEIRAHEKVCTEENICKSSTLPVLERKSNPSRNNLRSNNEPNVHNTPSTVAKNGNGMLSRTQTLRKILSYGNSRISVAPKSLSEILSQTREPCKSCGKLFVSSKLLGDHESVCLKQQLLLARFLSASSNTISPSNISRMERFGYQHKTQLGLHSLSNDKASLAANHPLRKKRMNLLPRKPGQNSNSVGVTQSDIFLCDICDKEFMSFTDIQRHEVLGCGMRRELTPSPVVPEGEKELPPEENFLRYFELSQSSQSQSAFRSLSRSVSRSKRILGNPMRYSAVPVSSFLGSLIHGTQVPASAILNKIEKVERYCPAKPISLFELVDMKNDVSEWRVSWKPRKNKTHKAAHSYVYPLRRWWKMPEIWNARMNIKKRNHRLLKICKSVQIKLKKLTARDIQLYSASRTIRPIARKLTREEISLYTSPKADMTISTRN